MKHVTCNIVLLYKGGDLFLNVQIFSLSSFHELPGIL